MSILQRLRERFWFIPAVLCVAAFVLAEALIYLAERFGTPDFGVLDPLLYRAGESGSRDVLGAIATSSLAVAGTTFSITMAVLALTSSSYGPRLVRNFMADRGNQAVLGVFVATFLYSLLVLRSIRVIGAPGTSDAEVFVPHLAVNLAVILAVLNVGVLIYFIHHISDSIQISTIASGVRADLLRAVDLLYPEHIGKDVAEVDDEQVEEPDERAGLPENLEARAHAVPASRPGYVQFVREDALLRTARDADVVVVMRTRPGRYVLEGDPLALILPAERATAALTDKVRHAIEIADARTPHQDVEFAVQQLTEMAVRALSPGTNDPYTAVNALDDLGVGLSRLAARRMPDPRRSDDDGALRVHAPRADVVDVVSGVLDAVRWYAPSAPSVMHAGLELAERVGRAARGRPVRARLLRQVDLLCDAFAAAGHQDHDVQVFREHADRVVHTLARP